MKLTELIEKLSLIVYTPETFEDKEISGGYTCDLLSDVMGNIEEGQIWITLQTHRNVAAIASLKDIVAVILVKNLKPDADMVLHAEEQGVVVLGTPESAFNISGQIYKLLT